MPAELYVQSLVQRGTHPPELAGDADRAHAEFAALSREQQREWEGLYEERMEEWTRGEDVRKRAQNAAAKAAKAAGLPKGSFTESGDDGGK